MKLEQFTEEIKNGVEKRLHELGINQNLMLIPVEKSNDRHLTGLVYEKPNKVTPCIYMEELFPMYERGTDIDVIIDRASKLMAEQNDREIGPQNILDFDAVKDNMSFQLMEYEKNENWLSDKVYERFGDFAKVPFISLSLENGRTGHTVLKKEHLSAMGITEREVLDAAQRGLDNQEVVFVSLSQMMNEVMGIEGPDMEDDDRTIYVLTNVDRTLGAAVITREGLLQDISEKVGGSYYVLPSSTHEVLIVPMNGAFSKDELSNMVREVNENEVSAEDFLSNKVQVFSASRDKLMNVEAYDQLQRSKIHAR